MTSEKPAWPARIERYALPLHVVLKTESYLRGLGKKQVEGIAYWTGTFNGDEALVNDAIFPHEYQEGLSDYSSGHVDLQTAFAIGRLLHERKQYLLIQLHTHPFEAFHSGIDDLRPISHRVGFVSIVIPYFAKDPMKDLSTWKVYEYRGKGRWRAIRLSEVKRRFVLRE
jgi:hypothetical protein